MPVLNRQPIGAQHGPDRLPEVAPTPLQRHYINLSAIALVAGAVAITMVEAGAPLSSPIVKLCVILAAPIFVGATADSAVRFWRSAWAWMPINRPRGLFRLTWVVAALLGIAVAIWAAGLILTA